jgi:hypothetical protein
LVSTSKSLISVTKSTSNLLKGKSLSSIIHNAVESYVTHYEKNLSDKIKKQSNSKSKTDTTDLFLKTTNPDVTITSLLKKIDKNLSIKTGRNGNAGSSSDNGKDDSTSDEVSELKQYKGLLAMAAAPLAIFGGKKLITSYLKKKALSKVGLGDGSLVLKYGDKLVNAGAKVLGKSKTLSMVGEKVLESGVIKVGSKALKKVIPFAGIPFAIWDLVTSVKDGYGDYKKYADAGDMVSANKAIGYTFVKSMGAVLGVVGSLAASTGVGLPIALAIDALSLAVDLYGDYLKVNTEEEAGKEQPGKLQDKSTYTLDKKNGPVLTNGDKTIPVSTPKDKAPITNSKQEPINIKKPNKVIKDLNKTVKKNLTVEKKEPENWLDRIFGSLSAGASNLDDALKSGAGKVMTTINGIIKGSGDGYIDVVGDDGKIVRKTGSKSWRLNNPGNIDWGPWAKAHGAIGGDHKGTAVFKTYEDGRKANYDLLFSTNSKYSKLDLYQTFNRYAPSNDMRYGYSLNNPKAYANNVLASLGGINQPIGNYNEAQRNTILGAIQKMEGFNSGTIKAIPAYSIGSDRIPSNQLALVHEGEMIIPSKNAYKIRSNAKTPRAEKSFNEDDLSEDFWINTFMVELANVVKREYLGDN